MFYEIFYAWFEPGKPSLLFEWKTRYTRIAIVAVLSKKSYVSLGPDTIKLFQSIDQSELIWHCFQEQDIYSNGKQGMAKSNILQV